jgi:hypothetical protein
LLLVQIDSDEIKPDRGSTLEDDQEIQQTITVLPSRDADHDLVPRFDQTIFADRVPNLAEQSRLQLFCGVVQSRQHRMETSGRRHGIVFYAFDRSAVEDNFFLGPIDQALFDDRPAIFQ